MDNVHGVFDATRINYVNSSGGQVDERNLSFIGSTQLSSTNSTDDDGVQTWTTTQRVLRGRSRMTTTDYSFNSMSHLPASAAMMTMYGSDDNRNMKNAPHQQNRFAAVREHEVRHGQQRIAVLPDFEEKRYPEVRHGRQRMTVLPDFGGKYYAKPFQPSSHRTFVDDQIDGRDILALSNPSTSFDQKYFEKASSSSSSAVDPFITMTNSFQPLIERQRNEFVHLFPHFKNVKFAEPEVLVRSIKEPDGSELIIETKVTRRQVEFR